MELSSILPRFYLELNSSFRPLVEGKDPCEGVECDFYSRCVALQNGSTICECPEICTSLYQPICGSDNEKYSNLCEMMVTSCTKQELITKDYDGECSMPIGMFK